jgi:hypothetical protein
MALTQEERARITDSKHKIQSIADSLAHVDPRKIPNFAEIAECLEDTDTSLRGALRAQSTPDRPRSDKKR